MLLMRALGAFAIIPASLLVALSFFVLVVGQKMAVKKIKTLGYLAAVMLWAGALVFLSAGSYTMATGKHPLMFMVGQMMKMHKQMMMPAPCPCRDGQHRGMMKPVVRRGYTWAKCKRGQIDAESRDIA